VNDASPGRLDRGAEPFFAEGIKLAIEAGDDPYRELARQALMAAPISESTASDAEPRLFYSEERGL
jgi:hypothetical protein